MSVHTIKGLRQEFKARGKFHTPPELAQFLRQLIPGEPTSVYDPTCGAGSLLSAFPDGVAKYGQDIDAAAVADAETIPGFHGHVGDVFTDPAWIDRKFDAIVANPPFSTVWEPTVDERFFEAPTVPTKGRADFAFLLHILWMLAPGGTAAVLQFPGIAYRGGREQKIRAWMTSLNVIDQVIAIPGDTFTDTSISTLCLVIRKGRTGDTIRFADREHGIERDVPIAEVEGNDWSWSVTQYVQPPQSDVDPIDPWALEQQARAKACRDLRAHIAISRVVAGIEEWPLNPFIDDLQAIIDEAKATA